MKKTICLSMEESVVDMLLIISAIKEQDRNEIVEDLIKDYIIKEKVDINEAVKSFWEK